MAILSPRDHYEELHHEAGNLISKYTLPIFENDHKWLPIKIATGVCLNIGGINYVITASHIFLERCLDDVGFLYNNQFIPFNGIITKTKLPEDEEQEKYDIAICQINKACEEYLRNNGNEFYKITKQDVSDYYDKAVNFLALGFPNSGTKINTNTSKIIPRGFRFSTKLERTFCDSIDIVLQYEIGSMRIEGENNYHRGPSLKGMSGSGIWFLKTLITGNPKNIEVRFCGILRQFIPGRNLVYANKTKIVCEICKKAQKN
jgi:hypothetical protein